MLIGAAMLTRDRRFEDEQAPDEWLTIQPAGLLNQLIMF
jgi:hypothetical protein